MTKRTFHQTFMLDQPCILMLDALADHYETNRSATLRYIIQEYYQREIDEGFEAKFNVYAYRRKIL